MEENVVHSPYPDIQLSEEPIHEFIFKDLQSVQDRTALVCGATGRSYTYKDVKRLSIIFGGFLRRLGLGPGQVLGVVLPNIPEYPIAVLGAYFAGMAVCPMSHMYRSEEYSHQIKLSKLSAVITYKDKIPCLQGVLHSLNRTIPIITISDLIIFDVPDMSCTPSPCSSDDIALIPFSSGTTDLPKGVCLTHRNIVANLQQVNCEETIYGAGRSSDEQETVLAVVLFSHMYGLVMALLLKLLQRAKIVTVPKYEKHMFVSLLQEHEVSMLFASPVLMQTLSCDLVSSRDLMCLKYINNSGSSYSGADVEKILEKKKDVYIFQNYGMTEASCMMAPPTFPIPELSIGRPLSNSKAKIVNPASGRTLGAGERGEICFKGPQVMVGYLNNPIETMKTIDNDGWLHTGDAGYYDDSKQFYVVGRLKEMIKVKGFQVSPSELEQVLCKHPQVLDAGVVGIPHYKVGEVPGAFIVPKNVKSPPSLEGIRSFLEERVASYKIISHAFLTQAIPKSATGKILRRELKSMLEKQDISKHLPYPEQNHRRKLIS